MMRLTTDVWSVGADGFPEAGSRAQQAEYLLRYAILAPSSHNTQPWRFHVEDDRIDVYADWSRWLRVADADQRELLLSVGCALENLVVAAEHHGLTTAVEYVGNPVNAALVARVRLREAAADASPDRPSELFDALTRRRTNHREYDGRPLPDGLRASLQALAVEPGISIHFTDDARIRRQVDALTLRADALQGADPEWREELSQWLGAGVFGTSWLMSKLAQFAVSHLDLSGSIAKKDHELLQSAPLLGLVAVTDVDRESRVRAGQVFERLFLAVTHAGAALQPMNQILQVAEVRDEFECLLPRDWGTPQITFRLGYAPAEAHTPRLPLEEVLVRGRR